MTKPEPKITVAVVYGSKLHVGGVEAHLLALFRRADPQRYRWVVIAPLSGAFAERARAGGAALFEWRPAQALDVTALFKLVRLLRHSGAGLVHVHSPRALLLGGVAARWLRLPCVTTVHLPSYYPVQGNNLAARLKRHLYRRVERLAYRWLTDRLIYVSPEVCAEARAAGIVPPARTSVIRNGIDLALFARGTDATALRQALEAPAGASVICCVGRLDEQKGVDVLLRAVSELKTAGLSFQLWLVGDGPLRADLQLQAERAGLDSFVRFLGFRADVPALLQASDIFVLPSRYEAMPMAILEALAAGLPCVVTDTGEGARLINHGETGFVVPVEDAAALAAALRRLLADGALRQRQGAAARRAAASFSDVEMAQQIAVVYAAALGAAKRV